MGIGAESMDSIPHEFSGVSVSAYASPAFWRKSSPEFCDVRFPLGLSIRPETHLPRSYRNLGLVSVHLHNLRRGQDVSTRVAVMYLGKTWKRGNERAFQDPRIRIRSSAVRRADSDPESKRERILLKGDVPLSMNPPSAARSIPDVLGRRGMIRKPFREKKGSRRSLL